MWSKMYIGLHVKYTLFLSNFDEIWIFSTDFRRNTQISNFTKIRLVGAESFYAGGQTDGHDEVNSLLSQFYERRLSKKYSNIKLHENPSSGGRVLLCRRTDRQTDMTKLTASFRNFANADFRRNTQISNFTKIRLVEAEFFYAGGQTDRRTWRS